MYLCIVSFTYWYWSILRKTLYCISQIRDLQTDNMALISNLFIFRYSNISVFEWGEKKVGFTETDILSAWRQVSLEKVFCNCSCYCLCLQWHSVAEICVCSEISRLLQYTDLCIASVLYKHKFLWAVLLFACITYSSLTCYFQQAPLPTVVSWFCSHSKVLLKAGKISIYQYPCCFWERIWHLFCGSPGCHGLPFPILTVVLCSYLLPLHED